MATRPEAETQKLLGGNPHRSGEASGPLKTKIEDALNVYLTGLSSLDLIERLVLGVDGSEFRAYIFNVLKQETTLQDAIDPRYSRLTQLGSELEQSLSPEVLLQVSYVNPSRVPELIKQLKKKSIGIESIHLKRQ